MKVSTRRYAKIQIRWVKNRFIKSKLKSKHTYKQIYLLINYFLGTEEGSPIIHELDTTDLLKWRENIFEKATKIFNENYFLAYEKDNNADLNKKSDSETSQTYKEIFEYNQCKACDKVFINKSQWDGK